MLIVQASFYLLVFISTRYAEAAVDEGGRVMPEEEFALNAVSLTTTPEPPNSNTFSGKIIVSDDNCDYPVCYTEQWSQKSSNLRVACRHFNSSISIKSLKVKEHDVFVAVSGNEGSGFCMMQISTIFECNGTESSLLNCHSFINQTCESFVEIECYRDGRLRLEGSKDYGRLEIEIDEYWRPICDSNWTLADATVACNQLGFEGALSASYWYGASSHKVDISELNCLGNESRLLDCPHKRHYSSDYCNSSNIVAIHCLKSDVTTGSSTVMIVLIVVFVVVGVLLLVLGISIFVRCCFKSRHRRRLKQLQSATCVDDAEYCDLDLKVIEVHNYEALKNDATTNVETIKNDGDPQNIYDEPDTRSDDIHLYENPNIIDNSETWL